MEGETLTVQGKPIYDLFVPIDGTLRHELFDGFTVCFLGVTHKEELNLNIKKKEDKLVRYG